MTSYQHQAKTAEDLRQRAGARGRKEEAGRDGEPTGRTPQLEKWGHKPIRMEYPQEKGETQGKGAGGRGPGYGNR
eukprot:12848328-Heterocapsa_arctica.AAC.1